MTSSRQPSSYSKVLSSLLYPDNTNNVAPTKKAATNYVFSSGPIVIDAAPEIVWPIVKDVNAYYSLSQGAITAHINGELAIDNTITLKMYQDKWKGKFLPSSTETISVVDNQLMVLGWVRPLVCQQGHSERYHVLKAAADNQTLSTISLSIPGANGLFVKTLLGKTITQAFTELNAGIKADAEQRQKLR